MVRHVFVALLFVVCAVYMAYAAPNFKLEQLEQWTEGQTQLDRVERGVGRRRGGWRGNSGRGGRNGGQGGAGRGTGRGSGGGQGGRGGGRRRGGGRSRNRGPPPQHGGQGPPPPRGRSGRQHGSSECDDDNNAAGQQGNNPTTTTTTTTTTRTTTTTTTPTTTTTTTTTQDPLVAKPVPDADAISGNPSGDITGCVVATGVTVDPSKIRCDQVQVTSDFQLVLQTFPHTHCAFYCQCSSNGVDIMECPPGTAWDPTQELCTNEATVNC